MCSSSWIAAVARDAVAGESSARTGRYTAARMIGGRVNYAGAGHGSDAALARGTVLGCEPAPRAGSEGLSGHGRLDERARPGRGGADRARRAAGRNRLARRGGDG